VAMVKQELLKKYYNLQKKVFKLFYKVEEDKKLTTLFLQVDSLICLTLELDTNNQLWSESLERTFQYLLEDYFNFTECWC
jgi:hypothetical protein